jgi:parallel beta-helix repeat protein
MRRFLCFIVGVAVISLASYHLAGDPVQGSSTKEDEVKNDVVNRSHKVERAPTEIESFDYIPQPVKRPTDNPTIFNSPNATDNQRVLNRMFGSGPGSRLAHLPLGSVDRLLSSLVQADRPDRSSAIRKPTQGSPVLLPHSKSKTPRTTAPKTAAEKIQRDLYEGRIYPYARNEDGTVRLTVRISADVTRAEAIRIIEKYGRVDDAPIRSNIFSCSIPEASILTFAGEAAVERVEPAPPDKEMHLDQSRATIHANEVQAAPYNLSGNGVTVSITDGGWVDVNHDDFAGRLTIGDAGCTEPDCGTHYHATHVGGILAGDGTLSGGNLRGLATEAQIRCYEWPDSITELDNEMSNAIAHGAMLSSNSWSWAVSAARGNCSIHGNYDLWSERYDEIVNGALGDEIVIICSSGNEENDGDCGPYPWNQVNPPLATAKNTITVGAIYSDNLDHTCFSSRGPLDDGRLKPDLVAPGDEGDDATTECLFNDMIRSTFPGDTYDDIAGTSMSTPMVSGTVALMREMWTDLGYPVRRPHTYKAVLVQTADDLGNPGPDYTYGHGLLDVQEAVDYVIRNYPNNELVRIGWVVDNERDTVYTSVPCDAGVLRVTLAWDDVPGTTSSTNHLINDLDLYLKSPSGSYYYAYVLNPSSPGNNATTGWNARDNVEVVEVQDPEPGKWMVFIWGWDIPSGSEEYTIVTPYEDINCGDYVYHDTQLGHDLDCTGDGLNLNADGIRFDGCDHYITGDMGAGDYGLWIMNNKNITVVNTRISNFHYGVYLSNADSCVIGAYDSLTANAYGIGMLSGSNANIAGLCWIENNVEAGVSIDASDYNIVGIWNEIDNNKRNVLIEDDVDYNYVYGNAIHDGEFYGVLTAAGGILPANDSISNNIIYNNTYGIRHYSTGTDNSIFANEIYDNDYGIYFYSTNNLQVYDNQIYSNDLYGVYMSSLVSGVIMTNNEICTNTSYDVYHTGGANSGNENMADVVYNWADDGQSIGTDWACSGCRRPEDNLVITSDMTICPGTYYIPDQSPYGVLILDADGITLDCNGAVFDGTGSMGGGEAVRSYGRDNNTVLNGNFRNYPYAIFFTQNANDNVVHNNTVEDCATGMRSYNSYRNTYSNNTVSGGTYGLLLAGGASADHYIHDNEFCENVYDISNEGTATGNNNRCDLAVSYADSGVVANCDFECTDCEVAPVAIDFGTVGMGGAADETFYITNKGFGLLTGTVSETCDHYWILSGEGAFSLAPGETLWVEIRLKPADYGVHLCTIQTGTSCANVACTGVTPDLVVPSVIVNHPNGGEQFEPGDSILVRWTATDNQSVDSVSIYYSTNGGGGYTLIAGGEPNTPPYLWMAPPVESDSCLVKVVAFDPGLLVGEDDSDTLFTIRTVTGVEEDAPILANKLEQNYPNPFNPSTSIVFSVVRPSNVLLEIYDVSGRLVRVLVDEQRGAGRYREVWDGKDRNAQGVASGVYFCRFRAGDYTEIRKMVLLR